MIGIPAVLSRGGFSHIWVRDERLIVKPAPTEPLNYCYLWVR
jgi:hypothetical protein